MKKIILIFLLVIVLAFCGLTWYVSYQMDWNPHKDKLADELSAVIGKKIVFSGNLDVSLLPSPQMSASDIEIVNPQTSEKLAVIKQLETSVSLRSLLKGTPDIKSLSLKGVEVWFKFDKNNVSNWHQTNQDDGEPSVKKPIKDVSFQSFSMKNSLVHVNFERYNTAFDLTNVNTDVQASSLRGPYRLDGNFMKDNDRYGLAFSIDSISQLEDIGLRFAITHPSSDSYIRYDGVFNLGSESFKGDLSGSSSKAAEFINIVLNEKLMGDEFNQPLMFSTTISSDEKAVNFSRLVIKFNEYIEGAGDVKLLKVSEEDKKDEIEVKYQLVNLDFLPLEKVIKNKFTEFREGTAYLPDTKFNLKYDLTAERVKISSEPGGIFENVSAKGLWQDNILSLDEFYAAGAGNVVTTMSGTLEEKDKKPHYFASVSIEGQNFLSWINSFGLKLTSPVQSVYRDGSLTFELDGDAENLKLSDIRFNIDKADINGEIAVGMDAENYNIKLTANKLNLDNYIALPAKDEEVKDLKGILEKNLAQLSLLKDLKLDIDAHLKNTSFRGVPILSLDLKAKTNGDDTLELSDLTAKGVMNSEMTFVGQIKNVSALPLFDKFNYNIRSQNFQTLADKLSLKIPTWPLFKQRNFEVKGVINGTLQSFTTETSFGVDDSSLVYKGSVNKSEIGNDFDGTITAKTTRLENVLKNFSVSLGQGSNSLRGAFNAEAKILGNATDCKINDLNAQHGNSHYTGVLNVKRANNITSLQGKISVTELNLLNWMRVQSAKTMGLKSSDGDTFIKRPILDADTFSYNAYKDVIIDIELIADKALYKNKSFSRLKTHILNDKGVMSLQNLSFNDDEVGVNGNLEIDYKQTPKLKGNLNFSNIKADNIGGSTYGLSADSINISTDFETSAVSLAEMFDEVSGTLNYTAKNIKFRGVNLAAIADDLQNRKYSKGLYQVVHDNLQTGESSFDAAEGLIEMNSGIFNIKPVEMRNDQILMKTDGSLNWKDWNADLLFKISYANLEDVPEYSFALSGSLNRPNLDIHIEDIAQKYDDYWRQVAEDEEALKNEETRAMNEKMEHAQQGVSELNTQNDELQQIIEKNMSVAFVEENSELYEQKLKRSQEISQDILAMQSVSRQTEFSDEDIDKINTKVTELKAEVEKLSSEVETLYEDDIRQKHDQLLKLAEENKTMVQKLNEEYEKLKADSAERLSAINAAGKLDENTVLVSLQDSIKADLQVLDNDYNAFMLQNSEVNAAEDVENRHDAVVDLNEKAENLAKLCSRLSTNLGDVKNKLDNLVQIELKAYEAARKAEIEANANNLLFTETQEKELDKKEKVEETIVEPKADNKAAEQKETSSTPSEAVKEVKKASGKIITSYERNNTQPQNKPAVQNSGILRQADGAVQKATGIITVK